jgi:large subunit ribosomal protein L10
VDRVGKKQLVSEMHETFKAAGSVVVTYYKGLTVAEITTLRNKLKNSGATLKVTKNSLARLALKGTQYEELQQYFTGPTAIAVSSDPIAAAKGVVDFANNNDKLVIVAGALNEKQLDASGVNALAKLPSLDELRARLLGMLSTPAQRIASVVQAPAGQIARVLSAHSQQ